MNSSHFMHRSPAMDLGCTANFSYNIKHAHLSPTSAHALSMGCEDLRLLPSVDEEVGMHDKQFVAYLFDTGVDRAVHGHFISKLMQLWALSHSGTMVSHVVLFRRNYINAAKSTMSKAQHQLLKVATEAIARKQQSRFEARGRNISRNSVPIGGQIPLIWADDIAHTTGPLRSLCLGHATFGTGYENLVGSSEAAASFRALLDETFPLQHTKRATPSVPRDHSSKEPQMLIHSNVTLCPPPRVVMLQRGRGSTTPRRFANIEAVHSALSAAAAELNITLPRLVEYKTDERQPLEGQVELFRSFGLLLSPHSSALKNLVFAAPHTAVVELQPTHTISNAFLTDVIHLEAHYEISRGHAPVDCVPVKAARIAGNVSTTETGDFHGVSYDASRMKWVSSIQVAPQDKVLGFFDSSEEAALKHDAVAISMGNSTLNFPLKLLRSNDVASKGIIRAIARWAFRCGVEVDTNLLTMSLVTVLKQQMGYCPDMWRKS